MFDLIDLGFNNKYPRFDAIFDLPSSTKYNTTTLKANVYKIDSGYKVEALVPGFTKDSIELSISNNNTLVININQKKEETAMPELLIEFKKYGSLTKSIYFNEEIDPSSIQASLKGGILEIDIKTLNKQAKKIDIKVM